MHAMHVDVSCQQFAVMRRVLKSSMGFDPLQSRHVRSSMGVPRRGVEADELANGGCGGAIVVGEMKLRREGAVLDALVGDVRLVVTCEENVLLRCECSDVGRLSKVSRGEPELSGKGKPWPGDSNGLLLLRRCRLLRGFEMEAGGLGGAAFWSAVPAQGAKGGGRTVELRGDLSKVIASGECWGVGRRSRGLSCD
jgi:hypothetical protein